MHPVPWSEPITPRNLIKDEISLIVDGARAAAHVADAYVIGDHSEQARRRAAGLKEVTSLKLLDAVMNLPLNVPIRRADVSSEAMTRFQNAPYGVVQLEPGWVTRLLTPPLTVIASVVRTSNWRQAAQRASQFMPFSQQIVMLEQISIPRCDYEWEAQLTGIGVWLANDSEPIELVAPKPFVRNYWKPAGWRFAERAYCLQLTSSGRPGSSPAAEDRQAHIVPGGSCLPQPSSRLR